jgi:hypothetical protein
VKEAGALAGGFASIGSKLLLVCVVESHHALASEVQGICGCEEREKADLDHCVVHDLILADLTIGCIAILELLSHRTVASGDGHTACENSTCLHDNVRTYPCQSTVDESG